MRSIKVDGQSARVEPRRRRTDHHTAGAGFDSRHKFVTVVRYDGMPETIGDPQLGLSGFLHTDDGALIAGEPRRAPRPGSRSTTTRSTRRRTRSRSPCRPTCRSIANGVLQGERAARTAGRPGRGMPSEPMASYLATIAIGEFDVRAYRDDGIRFWDAIDPDLFAPTPPHGRPVRDVADRPTSPTSGSPAPSTCRPRAAQLSFWVNRDTEPVGLRLRRGAHRRRRTTGPRCPTSTATRPGHRLRVPVLARAAPVPHALPDRQRRRHVRADRHAPATWWAATGRQ